MKKYLSVAVVIAFAALVSTAYASFSFQNNLSYGMTGNSDVIQLQTLLTSQGLYSSPVTGNFFSLTKAAVEAFQSAHSISPTGYVGQLTRLALNGLSTGSVSPSVSSKNTTPVSSTFVSPTSARFGVKTQVLQGIYETVSQPQDFVSSDQSAPQANAGDKYVSTYVSFDNESQNPFGYSISYFTVTDPTGASYNRSVANFYQNNPPDLSYGTANPSSLASGVVIFEVPATLPATSLTVHSESNDQAGNEAVVDFKNSSSVSSSAVSGGSTGTACPTGYTCSPTASQTSAAIVQLAPVSTPIEPTTLTDQEYAQQITENVTPFYSAAITDLQSAGTMLYAIGTPVVMADLKQAQSNITQAQNGMQALQGKVPTNMVTINNLMNEGLSSYSNGIGLVITAFTNSNPSEMSTAEADINQGTLYMNQVVSNSNQLNAQNEYQ